MSLEKKSKKFWNKQPCNIGYSKKKYLSREFFNEITKKRFFVHKNLKKFAKFQDYKNKKVLEIGCGIGTDGHEFTKNSAIYYGCDFSEQSISIAKNRFKIFFKGRNYNLFVENALNISRNKLIKRVDFDLIYSYGVLHHTLDLKKSINEIYKIAKKKTIIKIMLYSKNSFKNFTLNVSHYRYEAQKGCPIVKKITLTDFKKLIGNKFKIINAEKDFIFPYKIKEYKRNKYVKLPYFKLMPKKIFNALENKIGEHYLFTLRKN